MSHIKVGGEGWFYEKFLRSCKKRTRLPWFKVSQTVGWRTGVGTNFVLFCFSVIQKDWFYCTNHCFYILCKTSASSYFFTVILRWGVSFHEEKLNLLPLVSLRGPRQTHPVPLDVTKVSSPLRVLVDPSALPHFLRPRSSSDSNEAPDLPIGTPNSVQCLGTVS